MTENLDGFDDSRSIYLRIRLSSRVSIPIIASKIYSSVEIQS
jgi:hypothetical protein